jgi:hypothetical protein
MDQPSLTKPRAAAAAEVGLKSEIAIEGFPLRGNGSTWSLPVSKLDEWTDLYPGIDVETEALAARQWLRDNPDRRKVARGMARFLGSWLARGVQSGRAARLEDLPAGPDIQTPEDLRRLTGCDENGNYVGGDRGS